VAKDWTPAQLFMRLSAMISPPKQRKLAAIELPVAVNDDRTSFGKRPSPTKGSASRRAKKRK
jgi:hypothetical protein